MECVQKETITGLGSTPDSRLLTGKGKEPGLITVSGYEEKKRVWTSRINKQTKKDGTPMAS